MTELLTTVAILFIVAGPLLLLADTFDLPAVPLLLVAGIVAGGVIDDQELLLQLAQFGVALLVFAFGVGIQLDEIRTVLADSELAALGQILVVGSLGTAFGVAVGLTPGESVFLGVAGALSSTMVGTALVRTEIYNDLVHGRLAESINFVQDLVAIGIVLVVGAGVLEADPIAQQLGYGVALLVAAVAVNRYLFGVMERLAGGSDELLITGAISLLVLFVGAAEVANVSIVVGAFAAGIAIRHEPERHLGLFTGLESIKDFFLAIFFITVGALVVLPFVQLPIGASLEKITLALGLVLLTIVLKPAVTIAILIYKGYEARTATLTATSTDQVSEFALIIAIEALLLGLLSQAVFDAIIFAAAVTMITSTLTQEYNEQLYRWLATRGLVSTRHGKIEQLSHTPADLEDHVVIVGYDRMGTRVVEACESTETPYVVIENDPARLETVRVDCEAYIFGDAMETYTWAKATADDAALVVSTTPSEVVSWRVLDAGFDADVLLRASNERQAQALLEAGATYVIVSDLLAGEQLIEHLLDLFEGELTTDDLGAEDRQARAGNSETTGN